MTRDTTDSDRRLSRRQRAIVTALAVVCIVLAGAAVVTAQQQSYDDDFSDGNADGWELAPESGWEISPDSPTGTSNSLHGTTQSEATFANWDEGPNLALQETFNVSGTVKPQWNEQADRVRIGILNESGTVEGDNALILFDDGAGATYLGTWSAQDYPGSENAISSSFDGEWVSFRMYSPGNEDTLYAKVWEHGTQEPSEFQLEQDGLGGISGRFGMQIGSEAEREIWLGDVSVEGEVVDSEDLRLDVPKYLPHNESSHYAVESNTSGKWVDVTGQSTITTGNDDALTFYPSNNTVVAGGNKTINERVNITAQYEDLTATGSTVVATPTVDNLDLLPTWWKVNATVGDGMMLWLIGATLAAVVATRAATSFAGVGAYVMIMIAGWITGSVSDGVMVAVILTGLFLGLNLAANVDTTIRGSG